MRFSDDAEQEAQQRGIYLSRKEQYQATFDSYQQEMAALSRQLDGRRKELAEQEHQLRLVRELSALKEDQYKREKEAYQRDGVYKLQYLDAARSLAATERENQTIRGEIATLEKQLAAKKSQQSAFTNEWQAKSQSELAELSREIKKLEEMLSKQGRDMMMVVLG